MAHPLIIPTDRRRQPFDLGGFKITALASDADTGGYEIFHNVGDEGKGPGPHHHPWDETFFVLKGELRCGIHDTETLALPGTLVHVPGGATHWFKFGKVPTEFISITSKGNASKMFADFDQGINWGNPDRNKLIELAAKHGQVIL